MSIEPSTASGPAGAGAVAAGSRAAAQASAAILAQGGSAVDAVLAAGFASGICEPGLSSLAGGGFLMVRDPQGHVEFLDFFVAIPGRAGGPDADYVLDDVVVRFTSADQLFRIGPGSVAVPGCLDGFVEAHRRWGRLDLSDVVAPAIALAEDGVVLESAQAHVLSLIGPVLAHTPESRSLFTHDGSAMAEGDRFALPPMADVLRRIGRGEISSFAHPELLDGLLTAIGSHNPMSAQDVHDYAVMARDPLFTTLSASPGDAHLYTNPSPSFGGAIVSSALTELAESGGEWAGMPRAVLQATGRVKAMAAPGLESIRGTTHVSVVDSRGFIACMTTSAGSCAGVVASGTGIQLNNMMGESDLQAGGGREAAGARLRSMMMPSVLERSGGDVVALGSGGSERIRSAMSSVVWNLANGSTLHDAIAASRMHADDAGTLHIEPGVDAGLVTAAELALGDLADGTVVNHWSRQDFFFGGVNAVLRHPDGSVEAVADARRGGHAVVVSN